MTILRERLFRNLDRCSSIVAGDIRALRVEDMIDPEDVPLTRMDARDIPDTAESVGKPLVSYGSDDAREFPRRFDGEECLRRNKMGANVYVVGDVDEECGPRGEVYIMGKKVEGFSVKFYRV